jgi:hypothetical protein
VSVDGAEEAFMGVNDTRTGGRKWNAGFIPWDAGGNSSMPEP